VRCLISLVLGVAACGGSPPPVKPPPAPPTPLASVRLTVGAPGDGSAMLPLVDGQDIELAAGAQGGFHVMLELAARPLAAGPVWIERTARRVSDGAVVLRFDGQLDAMPDADGAWSSGALRTFMCPTPIGISIVDVPIAYQLRLHDDNGSELGRTSITLVPRCPAAQHDFCMRICNG
jgi:hypothetical protein